MERGYVRLSVLFIIYNI